MNWYMLPHKFLGLVSQQLVSFHIGSHLWCWLYLEFELLILVIIITLSSSAYLSNTCVSPTNILSATLLDYTLSSFDGHSRPPLYRFMTVKIFRRYFGFTNGNVGNIPSQYPSSSVSGIGAASRSRSSSPSTFPALHTVILLQFPIFVG